MNKLDLNDYSDREIVSAFFRLSASKFMTVINAIGAIAKRLERRGHFIAKEDSDEAVENMIRSLFEGNENEK